MVIYFEESAVCVYITVYIKVEFWDYSHVTKKIHTCYIFSLLLSEVMLNEHLQVASENPGLDGQFSHGGVSKHVQAGFQTQALQHRRIGELEPSGPGLKIQYCAHY